VEFFKLIFALLIPFAAGYCVTSLILIRREESGPLERFALAFLIGSGILSLEMLFLSFLRIPFSVINITLPLLTLLALPATIIFRKKACFIDTKGWLHLIKQLVSGPKNKNMIIFVAEKALVIFISLKILYVLFEALIKPIVGWDAFAHWSIKAKIFFFEKGIPLLPELMAYVRSKHGDYPLNLPFLQTWIATCLGSWNDVLIKIIFPTLFICTIFLIYSSLRRSKERINALFFSFLFASLPFAVYHGSIAYADFPLAVYYTASSLFLYRFICEKKTSFLLISAIALGLAGWTKNEGLALFVINLLVLFFFLIFSSMETLKERSKKFFAYAGVSLLFIVPWQVFKLLRGLPTSGDQMPQLSKLLEHAPRLPVIIIKFYEKMFFSGNWHLLWVLFFLSIILYYKKAFSAPRAYMLLMIALNIFVLGFIYYSTKSYSFLLDGTTLNRNFLVFAPIAIFFIGDILKLAEGKQ